MKICLFKQQKTFLKYSRISVFPNKIIENLPKKVPLILFCYFFFLNIIFPYIEGKEKKKALHKKKKILKM